MIIGLSMGLETCQILGQVSHNLLYWKKKHPDGYMWIYVVRGEINKKTAYIQARSSMVRTLEVNGKARQPEGKVKVEKPHLIRNGKRIDCKTSNCLPFVVPGLSASSSSTTPSPGSPSSSSQDPVFDESRYTENPVPERSGSVSKEPRGDPLHEPTETQK